MVEEREELAFSEIIKIFYRRRLVFFIGLSAVFIMAVLYLHFATYKYTATLTVTPTEQAGQGGNNSLNGLASMAGVDLSSTDSISPFVLYQEVLKTRQIADIISQDHDLMTRIFSKEWNAEKGQWEEEKSTKKSIIKAIKSVLGIPVYPWEAPSGAGVAAFLKKSLDVKLDRSNPIVTISLKHTDDQLAFDVLGRLHDAAENIIRKRTLDHSKQYITYLTKKLGTVTVAEHRQTLVNLLSQQEQMRMMASSDTPFAAEPFGPVSVSDHPTSPTGWLVLLGSILVGGLFGAALVVYKELKAQL